MEDEVSIARNELKRLQDCKDAIELEVQAILQRLNEGANPPGLSGNLVDKEVNAVVAAGSCAQPRQCGGHE
jgi:hypothetical protein